MTVCEINFVEGIPIISIHFSTLGFGIETLEHKKTPNIVSTTRLLWKTEEFFIN